MRQWILILLGVLSMGCVKTIDVPMQHVVMYDSDGIAVNPSGNAGLHRHSHFLSYDRYEDTQYKAHIKGILDGIDHAQPSGKHKIILFFHGGMNTQVESLGRLTDPFEKNPDKNRVQLMTEAGFYPIFVNWKSSLWSSYFEHLLHIRQGQRWPWYWGWPSALIIFPADVTRSIVRAPLVWSMQIYNDTRTWPIFGPRLSDRIAAELLCRYNLNNETGNCADQVQFQQPPNCLLVGEREPAHRPPQRSLSEDTFPIAVGEDQRRCPEMTTRFISYALTFPTKLAIGPVLDTFGTSAWDNMVRRIHLLFHSEAEMVSSQLTDQAKERKELATIPSSGGLSVFVQQLKNHMKGRDWEVVLVGHSMGTIVINELLHLFGDDGFPVSHIVYLAGAASVRDYENSVFPYLRRHRETHFYNFVLHPVSELGEIQYDFLDLTPRGTLLEWLDTFLANPETLMDRTVGRYDNSLRAMHDTPPELRPRVHFRSFSVGVSEEATNPQTHSDAAERFHFWKTSCWKVDAVLKDCVRED